MSKPQLLFLCHRIPYPPNKGDKIRSYHLLQYLCKHYDVHLGCFVDDEEDIPYIGFIEEMCCSSLCLALNTTYQKVMSLTGLLTHQPLTLPYYLNDQLRRWVRQQVDSHDIERCVVFSSSMGQYLEGEEFRKIRSVVDLVDVDSDKWRQYADNKIWPLSWLYRREAKLLLDTERRLIERSEQSLLVSSTEAELMRKLTPGLGSKIDHYNNGVDATYFDPSLEYENPYPSSQSILVFTGAMDYWPNVDAVCWFAKNVFPELKALHQNMAFYIVGRNPVKDVKRLDGISGITVTGGVADIRAYLQFADVVVAPLRVARGIQNKVLEAMAMEKTVLSSSQGLEGIEAELGVELLLADTLSDYLEYLPKLLAGECESMGKRARECILKKFDWDSSLPIVAEFLEGRRVGELQDHGL